MHIHVRNDIHKALDLPPLILVRFYMPRLPLPCEFVVIHFDDVYRYHKEILPCTWSTLTHSGDLIYDVSFCMQLNLVNKSFCVKYD
jgi:hypothetical protein